MGYELLKVVRESWRCWGRRKAGWERNSEKDSKSGFRAEGKTGTAVNSSKLQ